MSYCTPCSSRQIVGRRCLSPLTGTLILAVAFLLRGANCDDARSDPNAKAPAALDDEKSEGAVSTDERTTAKIPELVYLTWQRSKNADGKRALNQLWNGKGDVVPFDEAKRAILGTDSL